MKLFFLSVIMFFVSNAKALPLLVPSPNGNQVSKVSISNKKYTKLLNRSLRKTQRNIKKHKKKLPNDLKLQYVVIGLSLDIRKGFSALNFGLGKASEFHFKVLEK